MITLVDTFPPSDDLGPGRSVMSTVPDPETIPGISGENPGRAYQFENGDIEVFVDLIEVGLSSISGTRDLIIAIHTSVFLDIAFTGVVREIPDEVLASARLVDVLSSEPSVVAWTPSEALPLQAGSSYFLSVTIPADEPPSRMGWHVGDQSDAGFLRSFMHPDRSWGTYAFNTYPRGALRISGTPVPEPSALWLTAIGLLSLLGLSMARRLARRCS
jgi:hypothetical protein